VTLRSNSAEGGTAGTGATTANSGGASGEAFSQIVPGAGGTIEFSTAQKMHGSLSYAVTQATAATISYIRDDHVGPSANFAVRAYVFLTGYPSAETQFPISVRTAGDVGIVRLQMTTAGLVRVINTAGTTLGTTSAAIPLNTWVRLEFYGTALNGSAGTLGFAYYLGDSTSAVQTLAYTAVVTTGLAQVVRYGKLSSAVIPVHYLDDVASDLTGGGAPLGPPTVLGTAALFAHGVLAASGRAVAVSSIDLSAATVLTADGLDIALGTAALAAGTALAATGLPVAVAEAELLVGTVLTGTGSTELLAQAELSAGTALTVAALLSTTGTAALRAATALTADGVGGKFGEAALRAGTELTTEAAVGRMAQAALTAGTALTATGAAIVPPEDVRGVYRVYVRDAALRFLGQVDDFLTLEVTKVYNDVGNWVMTISAASGNADLLDPALNPGGGVVVIRDDEQILSGPIDAFAVDWSIEEGNDVITAAGPDDNVWLWSRTVYPNPAQTPEVMTTAFYWGPKITAESTMINLVRLNLGESALVARRMARLYIPATLGRGKTQRSPKLRFDVLGLALQRLSVLSQVGADVTTQLQFDLRQEGRQLVFRVTNGAGKATFVRFSKRLGTIRAYQVTSQAPTATDLVLGAGLEEASGESGVRIAKGLFSYQRTDLVFPRRVEQFVDVGVVDPSNADTPLEMEELQDGLDQQAADAYETGAGQVGATVTPRETSQLAFGRDYNLGDFCTVSLPRLTFVERIREVVLTVDVDQGEQIALSIGTSDGAYKRRTRGVYKRISDINDYINRLKTGK
jgi:hypothetical protein